MRFGMFVLSSLVLAGAIGCASAPMADPSRRALDTIDVSFTDDQDRRYAAEILVPTRPNGAAAMLLGGGSVTDMHWTVPGSIDLDGRTIQFTTTGQPIRDADALTAALLNRGFHVLRWSSIHEDDPQRAENPALAEGLPYDKVRALARQALQQLREHEATANMSIVLIGHSLGAARAVQIAAGQDDIAALVLLSGAYISPLAVRPAEAGLAISQRHGVQLPAPVAELDSGLAGQGALRRELGMTDRDTLDLDGDGTVLPWEIGALEALARLRQGDRTPLTNDMILNEPHPGVLLQQLDIPVLAVFGGEDPITVHGPVIGFLAAEQGSNGITVWIEPGLGHGLGRVEPPPARDADIIAGVLGPISQQVVERVALWASERVQ